MSTPTDEQLAAWLAGDLDEVAAADVRRSVSTDATVAARADAIADVMAGLAVGGTPSPPSGLAAALLAGLGSTLDLPLANPAAGEPSGAPGGTAGASGTAASMRDRPAAPTARAASSARGSGAAAGSGAGRAAGAARGLGAGSDARKAASAARLQRLGSGLAVLLLVVTTGGLLARSLREGPASLIPDDADGQGPTAATASAGDSAGDIDVQDSLQSPTPVPGRSTRPPTSDGDPSTPSEDGAGVTSIPPTPATDGSPSPVRPAPTAPGSGVGSSTAGGSGSGSGPGSSPPAPPPAGSAPAPAPPGAPAPAPPTSPQAPAPPPPAPAPPPPAPAPPPPAPAPPQPAPPPDGGPNDTGAPPTAQIDEGDTAEGTAPGDDIDASDDGQSPPPQAVVPDEDSAESEDSPGQPAPEAVGSDGPTIADTMADLPDGAAVRAYFGGRPETRHLLGTAEDDAEQIAEQHRRQVRDAPVFQSGDRPSACLATALVGQQPAVVAAVESVVHDGVPALAYLVVRGTPALDHADVTIADPKGCTTLFAGSVAN